MAKQYRTKNGKIKTWYSPKEKFKKYGNDLDARVDTHTNEVLSDAGAGFRIGYRKALAEQASLHNLKKRNRTR